MIYLYSGTPGSGKSLHVASVISEWLLWGKPVITNFYFDADALRGKKGKRKIGNYLEVDNDSLTPELLERCSRWHFKKHRFKEETILLVIDEAQLLFNAREWNIAGRKEWMSFFTQHRKLGYQIILVAQFDRMLDRQIRSLLEYEYVHRKVSNFGIAGKLLSLWCGGRMHMVVKLWYPLHEKIGNQVFIARKGIYKLYDSYKKFASDREPAGAAAS